MIRGRVEYSVVARLLAFVPAILGFALFGPVACAATFYCDPVLGSPQGDGSSLRPWRTLQEVVAAKKIQILELNGTSSNPTAPVKPGDTVLLRSGYHGILYITKGYNPETITIAADEGATPQLGWVEIREGQRWLLKGLTISPEFATDSKKSPPSELVKLAEHGGAESCEMVIEDCFICTTFDSSNWTADDWVNNAKSGIRLGRHGRGHVARNNFLLNVRFGINLCAVDCLCEGNVICNFSGDGIRALRDGLTVQYNIIKNNYCGTDDGDPNHDDGIQVFLFNVGTGTVRDMVIRGNLIVASESDDLPFSNPLMGISCFDGPLVDFLVEDNVVNADNYHGISLYDAQGCLIRNNTCYSSWNTKPKPWIMLGQKLNLASGNTVTDNFAHSYNFRADTQVTSVNNQIVTETVFDQKYTDLASQIIQRFGNWHPTANQYRFNPATNP